MIESTESERHVAPLARAFARLRAVQADFDVHAGEPSGAGWIDDTALAEPERGPLSALLARITGRMRTSDRRVVASSFALRFGWASGAPLAAYVLEGLVPDLSPGNVALRFSASDAFERLALRHMRATAAVGHTHGAHPLLREVADRAALLAELRRSLIAQATPVVGALSVWARTNPGALWGLVTSSWGSQCAAVALARGQPHAALSLIAELFAADEPAFAHAPAFFPLDHAGVQRVYHRRGSCCLYYKTGSGTYCASCPLIDEDERRARNCAWIDKSLVRR